MKLRQNTLMLCVLMSISVNAQITINGVTLPEKIKQNSNELGLNGTGIRKKLFFKVYTCGLYLTAQSKDANDIINADKVIAFRLIITSGVINSINFCESMQEGFRQSLHGNTLVMQPKIDEFMRAYKNEEIKEGDILEMWYLPGDGVKSYKNGNLKNTISGLDFKKALFGIWLGENPVDVELKAGLLTGYPFAVHLPEAKSNVDNYQYNSVQNNKGNSIQPKIANEEKPKPITIVPDLSDVDVNIPIVAKPNFNRFALVIGNEDYHSNQPGLQVESDVKFAAHDATTFKEYAIKVIGVPEENLIFLTNAKLLDMNRSIDKLSLLSEATGGVGEMFFYYAGHGYPDEKTKESYLIPVDVSGADLKYAIKLNDIYKNLATYQSKRVTIFLDACFSGGAREEPLLVSRGIKIKPKETTLGGNEVVFCATSNDQSALVYKAKGHGMFTYFLLKQFQETKGDIAYGELFESLQKQVGVKSILENSQLQSPTILISPIVGESWKMWRIN